MSARIEDNTTPVVTVIIPTYNRANLIGRALRSVTTQTYPHWECLVVDDASTDNTAEAVTAFGSHSRIHYLRHETNKGASAARNTGIRAARGEYLAFLDSDDEWLPQKLEKQLAVFQDLQDPRLGAVLCGRILVTPQSQRPLSGPELEGDVYRSIITHGLGGLGTSGYLVHQRVFQAGIRFDDSFPACQDREFMAQVARRFGVKSLSEPLIKQHRGHGDGHLWSGLNAARGLERLIHKYSDDLRRWPVDLARLHLSTGIRFVLGGDGRAGRRHLVSAWRLQPRQRSVYVWLLVSMLGQRVAHMLLRVRPDR